MISEIMETRKQAKADCSTCSLAAARAVEWSQRKANVAMSHMQVAGPWRQLEWLEMEPQMMQVSVPIHLVNWHCVISRSALVHFIFEYILSELI
jgi:hypothetical protein